MGYNSLVKNHFIKLTFKAQSLRQNEIFPIFFAVALIELTKKKILLKLLKRVPPLFLPYSCNTIIALQCFARLQKILKIAPVQLEITNSKLVENEFYKLA